MKCGINASNRETPWYVSRQSDILSAAVGSSTIAADAERNRIENIPMVTRKLKPNERRYNHMAYWLKVS